MRETPRFDLAGAGAGLLERREQLTVLGGALAEVAGSSHGRVVLVAEVSRELEGTPQDSAAADPTLRG